MWRLAGVLACVMGCADEEPLITMADLASAAEPDLAMGCPPSQPSGSCGTAGLECAFGSTICACLVPEDRWLCCAATSGGGCPARTPSQGAFCCPRETAGVVCDYCGLAIHTRCSCVAYRWSCPTEQLGCLPPDMQ